MMREGPKNSIFMCYPRYDREIELPCPRLSLYSVKSLTLQMEKNEPAQRSVAGPQTRTEPDRTNKPEQDHHDKYSSPHYYAIRTVYTEYECRGSLWVLCLWRPELILGRQQWVCR